MNKQKLDAVLEHITELGTPGCSMIIHKDHEEIYRGKAGVNDTETNSPIEYDAIVNLYSSSKVITCVAMMQIIGNGKVLLDDPLYKYLPEFKNVQVRDHDSHGREFLRAPVRDITIRHLMTMSAGLDYDLGSEPIRRVRERTGGRCPTVETMRELATKPLLFDPGEHYEYSLCHDVLGAVIEVCSGMSFGEYLKKNIFEPLEMNDTTFHLTDEQKKRLACQYRYNGETGKVDKITTDCAYILGTEYESGGAGIFSTLDDYGKFVDALACGGVGKNGARIISEDMLSLMHENQFTDAVRYADFAHAGYGYGLGVRTHIDRGASGCPAPLGEFGWGGAAGTQMIIDPVNHISMFYLQHMLMTPFILRDRIANVMYS